MAATAKFISWSSKSRESSEEVKTGYSLGEDMEEGRSEEFDILMVKFLDMLAGGMQEERKQSFRKVFGRQVVFIPFEKLPGPFFLI